MNLNENTKIKKIINFNSNHLINLPTRYSLSLNNNLLSSFQIIFTKYILNEDINIFSFNLNYFEIRLLDAIFSKQTKRFK